VFGKAKKLFGAIGIGGDLDISDSNKIIGSVSTRVSYDTVSSDVLANKSEARTTIHDKSGVEVPVNILQDSIFQGIAVQDTDMHYQQPGPGLLPPLQRFEVFPQASVPIIERRQSSTTLAQLQQLRAVAARRHFARVVPPPRPAVVVEGGVEAALRHLEAVRDARPSVQKAIKSIRQRQLH
jgi:hypothetical protein